MGAFSIDIKTSNTAADPRLKQLQSHEGAHSDSLPPIRPPDAIGAVEFCEILG
jgi:hypothetical protein